MTNNKIISLLTSPTPTMVSAPMVRYSKLPFRALVREYNCHITYTPMILAREFVRNATARYSDFTTNAQDTPLVAQVGVNNTTDLLKFVQMTQNYVDGIGINCGCPIRDQVREGIGAALMSKCDLVCEMVRAVKQQYDVVIEVKIRIHEDLNETIKYARAVEEAGADYITVHGRTKDMRSSEAVNLDAIKLVKESVRIPVVANGDCFKLEDVKKIVEYTGCNGVMAARGLLENPALFAGYQKTPWGAIERFWDLATSYGLPFRIIQHHLSCMMEKIVHKKLLKSMNDCSSLVELIDWFDNNFELKRSGEKGFGEAADITWKVDRNDFAHI